MTDAAGTRVPDVDPYGGLEAAPEIDWDDIESDHDDDEARVLIAQARAEGFPEPSLETGEIPQPPDEEAEAEERERKQTEAEAAEAKRKQEQEEERRRKEALKKEEEKKIVHTKDRKPWNDDRGAEEPTDWKDGFKWQRHAKPTKDKTRYTCELCNVETVGEKSRDSHLRGKSHLAKARQAKFKSVNDELSRHGARIAEQQAKRSLTPDNDPESRFQHPDHPNGRNQGSSWDSALADHRRDGNNGANGGEYHRREEDVRGNRPSANDGQSPASSFYKRSTDPRPRYFDHMVTSDPNPSSPQVSNGGLPELESGDSRADLERQIEPVSSPTGTGRGGDHGDGRNTQNDRSAPANDRKLSRYPAGSHSTLPHSSRPVTPDTPSSSQRRAEQDVEPAAKPRTGSPDQKGGIADGKSPFMRTGPKKSTANATGSEQHGTSSAVDGSVSVPSSKEVVPPRVASAATSKAETKRPVSDSAIGAPSGARAKVGGDVYGTTGTHKTVKVSTDGATQDKDGSDIVKYGNAGVDSAAPREKLARVEDGRNREPATRDGTTKDRKPYEDDRRKTSREAKRTTSSEREGLSNDKRPRELPRRSDSRTDDRGRSAARGNGSSRDERRRYGNEKRENDREDRRSPPYDRKSRRDESRSPDLDRSRSLDDRSGRYRSYDREDSRGDRRSPPHDRYSSRDERWAGSYERSSRREEKRSPPFDRGQRDQRRRSPDRSGDVRESRRSPPYDRTETRDGRRSSQDDRGYSSGDRKRSRYASDTDAYGDSRRTYPDSRPSDRKDGRRPSRRDGETREDERRKLSDYKANSAPRSERPAAEPGASSSREKEATNKDRDSRASPPTPQPRLVPPPPPLKLRSQAVPLRSEDDGKKRPFAGGIDTNRDEMRFRSAPAPYDSRANSKAPGEGKPRYDAIRDGTQRRRLLEPGESERARDEARQSESARDDARRNSFPLERSMSQRYGGSDPTRRHTIGASQPEHYGGQGQSYQGGSGTQSAGTDETFNPELYPTVPEEYLNEPMSVSEWREFRHFILNEGSDVDKLAYKMMQEIILSPVLGINDTSLAPFSRAMMAAVNKQYNTPKGVFAKLSDYPPGLLRLDPKYNSTQKGDEDWSRYQTPEYLALCQVRDNIDFTFNTNEDAVKQEALARADFPPRGSFGVRNQRKGPGIILEGERPPRYEDAVVEDPLFKQIMNFFSVRDMATGHG